DEAVRDLLKARRIKLAQCLDVVAQALRVGEKAVVGKDDGAGEVGAEGQESEAPCGVRAQWRRANLGLDGVAGRQFGIEAGQLELPGGGDGAGLEPHHPRRSIETVLPGEAFGIRPWLRGALYAYAETARQGRGQRRFADRP